MTPLSSRALNCIESRLRRITEAGGFHTSAGANVRRSAAVVEEALGITVWCSGETATGAANGAKRDIVLSVEVVGYVPASQANTGHALECIKADIKVAVLRGWNDYLHDDLGHIGEINYTGATLQPRGEGATGEAVALTFEVRYAEGVGNPYGPQDARRAV